MNRHLSKQLRPLMGVAVILSLYLGSAKVAAQPGQPFAGMDPQQIQQQIRQRAMEFFRDKLEVTKEEEWTVIETRLGKVVQLKAQTLIGGMLGGGGSPFGGGRGGDNPMAGAIRSLLGLDEVTPEMQALRRSVDGHGSNEELKAAVAKVLEARKRKQAELDKAQSELRQVLTFRQEATLSLLGVLD